jgi:nitrate ABC transporter ATP-binding subunit
MPTETPIRELPALEVRNVTMTFDSSAGRVVAIREVSLDIRRGEFVTLIGHSGCGKSTLLHCLAGLYRPTAGQVLRDGFAIEGPGPDRGVVFQNYSLLPWLTVYDNVWEAVQSVHQQRMARDEMRRQVEAMLRAVALWEHRKKHPPDLSGGMRQRVAIARAFAIEPAVLLLDEPFGALDALTRASLQDELVSLWAAAASGARRRVETVVMVTHDMDEAIYLSDRIVVFTNGPAATIAEVIPVSLPRPRERRHITHSAAYADIKDHLMERLVGGAEGRGDPIAGPL